jgi:hypothetical protein
MLTPGRSSIEPRYTPTEANTARTGDAAAARAMAALMESSGRSRDPSPLSLPLGATKMAREASPSMPSQLVSRNSRSGASASLMRHSQPLVALLSASAKPSLQRRPHMPAAQVAVWLVPAGHTVPQVPQLAGSVM